MLLAAGETSLALGLVCMCKEVSPRLLSEQACYTFPVYASACGEEESKYSEDYLKSGFTTLISNGIEMPQCIQCNVVLSSESITESIIELKTQMPLRDKAFRTF